MRLIFSVFFCVISLFTFSQHLNKLGKIDVDEIPSMSDFRVQKTDNIYKVYKDSFVFDGNGFYEIPNGFITSLETIDDKKDYIKHYNSNGKLIVTILSDRIINLKTSKKGNKLAFHNSNNIIHVDLNTYKVDTLQGSFIYSFMNDDFVYYNSDKDEINFRDLQIKIEEYPSQFVDYKGKILVITKQNIYELTGNSLFHRYEFKGKFFDAKLIDEDFYFVDKIEKRKSEIYSLYKTSDFSKFILIDRLDDLNR